MKQLLSTNEIIDFYKWNHWSLQMKPLISPTKPQLPRWKWKKKLLSTDETIAHFKSLQLTALITKNETIVWHHSLI